jgi:hypothetical protein
VSLAGKENINTITGRSPASSTRTAWEQQLPLGVFLPIRRRGLAFRKTAIHFNLADVIIRAIKLAICK